MTEDWRKTDDMDDYAAKWRRESDGIPQRRLGGMYWRMSYGGGAGDGDVAAWVAAVKAAGGTVSNDQASRVTDLLAALKGGGVWTLLDRLWLFAAEDSTQALTDIKSLAVATAVNSPTFTENRGYAGNGTTAYINSNFNPGTGSPNFTQNAGGFGCWVETAQTSDASQHRYMGNDDGNFSFFSTLDATNNRYAVGAVSGKTYAFTTQTGLWHAQRSASNLTTLYYNGASVDTTTAASVAVPSKNFIFLAGDGAFAPTDGRLAAGFVGNHSAAQIASLYSAMRTYMTAVGVA